MVWPMVVFSLFRRLVESGSRGTEEKGESRVGKEMEVESVIISGINWLPTELYLEP